MPRWPSAQCQRPLPHPRALPPAAHTHPRPVALPRRSPPPSISRREHERAVPRRRAASSLGRPPTCRREPGWGRGGVGASVSAVGRRSGDPRARFVGARRGWCRCRSAACAGVRRRAEVSRRHSARAPPGARSYARGGVARPQSSQRRPPLRWMRARKKAARAARGQGWLWLGRGRSRLSLRGRLWSCPLARRLGCACARLSSRRRVVCAGGGCRGD